MTLAIDLEMESSNLGGMINDLSAISSLWKNDDFAKLGSVPEVGWNMIITYYPYTTV
jgi:hypothetical protein